MKALQLAVLAGFATASPAALMALPSGASVAAGSVSIAQAATTMTITQASQNAIVNWQSFDIGAGNLVQLLQPNASAAMLARVTGSSPTSLQGMLQANGRLFLINPKGIIIGKNAIIHTAGFTATTLDVDDESFLADGPLTFRGDSAAGVVNLGSITASEGNVYLFAHTVSNSGSLSAPNGTAGLAAGTEVELASPNAPGFTVKLNVPSTSAATGVDNSGVITAAQARLQAAGGSLYELAVNQSGVIRATGSATVDGRVLLTADGGTVGVSGSVSAHNADGSGGKILVGGDVHGNNPAVPNASRTVVTSTGSLDASAVDGTEAGGQVTVWSDQGTRFLGKLTASGSTGGFAEVSSKHYLDFNPASPVQLGTGGNLLLDPDALVISTSPDSETTTASGNPYVFGSAAQGANLNVATLENQLALSNVTLDTSTSGGDITVSAPVTWSTNNTLRLNAGGSINLNANITGGSGSTLALYAGLDTNSITPAENGGVSLSPGATLDSSATIAVGTLIFGANSAANVAGQTVITPASTGGLFLEGNISVKTLEIDLSGGQAGVVTNGTDNSIGAFVATGSSELASAYVVNNHGSMSATFNATVAQGPYVQFITSGNLTLTSGSRLAFDPSSPGTAILASTGGAFINQAGSTAFGSNANFQIYTSSPAATTLDGLTGTDLYAHPYNSNDSYTGNYIFFASSASSIPVLTYTADDLSRTYGDTNPGLTYTTTGWQQGITDDVTGAPALSVAATQSSGVGAYQISIGSGTLASSNYDFSFVPGTLTITKAPLTITADDASRVYGSANPAFSYTATGFVNGDSSTVLSGAPSLGTSATSASSVGSDTISAAAGSLSASNYDFTFAPGTLDITPAPLTVTILGANRTYGSANPAFNSVINGFKNGDTSSVISGFALSTTATPSSNPGDYLITGSGTAANYKITFDSAYLLIQKAPVYITIPNETAITADVPSTFPGQYTDPAPDGLGFTITGVSSATNNSAPGVYPITPVITGDNGVSLATLETDYTFGTKQVGRLTLKPPAVVTDTISLQPGTLLQNTPSSTIVQTNITQNQTVTVNQPQSLNVTIDNSKLSYQPRLTPQQYANFLGEFAGDTSAVQKQLASNYATFLKGRGVSNSAYEKMPSAARTLLEEWMSGTLTTQALQQSVAQGDPAAIQAFAFILPGLVQLTLSKPTSALTFTDNTVLSRLSTLTAQHMSNVVQNAKQDYKQMVSDNAKNAANSGLTSLLTGSGDFSNIVQQANQQALGEYLGATIGATAAGSGAAAALATSETVLCAVFPNTMPFAMPAIAAAGPAIVVMNMAILAVRAVQVAQSEQNQAAYNKLIASWPPGSTIDTVSQLKAPGMSQNVQIGTAMLALDLISSGS